MIDVSFSWLLVVSVFVFFFSIVFIVKSQKHQHSQSLFLSLNEKEQVCIHVCIFIYKIWRLKEEWAECWRSKPIGCICSYNTFDGCLDAVYLAPGLSARSRQTTHQPEWQAKAWQRLADRLYFYFKGLKVVDYAVSSIWTTLTNTRRVGCLQHWTVDYIRSLDCLRRVRLISDIDICTCFKRLPFIHVI